MVLRSIYVHIVVRVEMPSILQVLALKCCMYAHKYINWDVVSVVEAAMLYMCYRKRVLQHFCLVLHVQLIAYHCLQFA
jgi:hypothetical protein